ncbi:MAG: D-glycerate dehydrogenase [Chloroflexi bacterium]|nr:D-glycerate dehydrogenase [Chloroflexota bacterium]
MPGPRVFVSRRIFPEVIQRLAQGCQVSMWEDPMPPPRAALLAQVADCDGLFATITERVDGELMAAAPRLRVVSNMAVGYDNVDVAEATRRGILVGNTPGVLTETTADLAFALLLAAARRVAEGDRAVRQGAWRTWDPMGWLGYDIHGATLGIVGLGRIGLEVAKRARGFGMHILYHSRQRRPEAEAQYNLTYCADLDTLLRQADFVTLHVPLNKETHYLVGAEQLRQMKPTAILVNTARGSVVDQRALYEALRDGVIAAAGLDVMEQEPVPLDDPLLTLPNCVVTPHIGSASVATRRRMAEMATDNLLAALGGQPMLSCVNPAVARY